ncbi:MAG: hypothetical protein WBP55_07010 [Solirubrobacterales bacterium]
MGANRIAFPPQWPDASPGAGMYESYYMRAVSPDEEVGVWIRYTVQKAPGRPHRASIWFTMFDNSKGSPIARKTSVARIGLASPHDQWISIGSSSIGAGRLVGEAGDARWSIRVTEAEPGLQHLGHKWLYRTTLPRTKPESPVPFARFEGQIEIGDRRYTLDRWPGMLGHNWGSEHAWTWVWLSGAGFEEDPDAWVDLVLGRVKVGGRLTPWVANGAISIDGERHRLGGMLRRGAEVVALPGKTMMSLPGEGKVKVELEARAPRNSSVAWQYGSPDGHIHDVINCSIAPMEISFSDGHSPPRTLSTGHGGTYELGLPDRQDWVKLVPIPDKW